MQYYLYAHRIEKKTKFIENFIYTPLHILSLDSKVFQKNTFFDFNEADNIFPLHYTM